MPSSLAWAACTQVVLRFQIERPPAAFCRGVCAGRFSLGVTYDSAHRDALFPMEDVLIQGYFLLS